MSVNNKVHIFSLQLFWLVILGEISHIYIVSNSQIMKLVIDFIQVPLYFGLIFLLKRKYNQKQLLYCVAFGCFLLVGYIRSGQAAYFRGFLLILAAKEIPFKQIVHVCRNAISCIFVFTLILWVLGISDSGMSNKGKLAFGYGHPNNTAQTIMIIMLLWLAEKGESVSTREYIVFEISAVIIIMLTGSKTSAIVIALAPLMIGISKWSLRRNRGKRLINFFMEVSQIVVLLFTWWSAKALPNLSFLKKLDLIVTNRLFLNYYLFNKYPLKLFGQNVSLREGEGVYNNIQDVWGAAITCDNTYALSLLIMGIIPTAIFLFAYVLLIRKAIKMRDYTVISIAILCTLYAFCECSMVEIYNNFGYFYILAASTVYQRERTKILIYDT